MRLSPDEKIKMQDGEPLEDILEHISTSEYEQYLALFNDWFEEYHITF